jgi:hypothetical protein
VVGDEPDAQEHPQQHDTWLAIKASKRIELVATKDLAQVEQHLAEKNVQPWRSN